MSVRRGIFVAPFDELVEPRLLAELAAEAESRGWDGFFVWDHIRHRSPVEAVADPWVALSAIAFATVIRFSGSASSSPASSVSGPRPPVLPRKWSSSRVSKAAAKSSTR